MTPVAIDTNVVAAGLITDHADSPTAVILEGMLRGEFPFVLSIALLTEYRQVLVRPRLRAAHGLGLARLDAILAAIARHAIVLDPPRSANRAPDAGDQHLWDLLGAREDLKLVTGDAKLIAAKGMAGRVLSPANFAGNW